MNRTPDLFDQEPDDGRRGRDQGMAASIHHADDVLPAWSERAYRELCAFARSHPRGHKFVAPAARRWAIARGLPIPPSQRAWGGVFFRAAKAGLLRRSGFTQYGDDSMHLQAVVVWEVV